MGLAEGTGSETASCSLQQSHVRVFKLRPKCEVMLSWDFGEVLGFGGEVGSWFVFFFFVPADGVTSQLDWNGPFLVLR